MKKTQSRHEWRKKKRKKDKTEKAQIKTFEIEFFIPIAAI